MSYKIISLGFILCFMTGLLSLAQTNPKWLSTDIAMTPSNPKEGDTVTFTATFRVARDPVDNLVVIGGVDSTELFRKAYPSIEKSQDVEVFFNWTAKVGTHRVYMQIDPDNLIREYIETDNLLEKRFIVPIAESPAVREATSRTKILKIVPGTKLLLKPDLVVTEIKLKFSVDAEEGNIYEVVEVTIKNIGIAKAPASQLSLSCKKGTAVYPTKIVDYPEMNKDESSTKRVRIVRALDHPGFQITGCSAKADYKNLINEINDANNMLEMIF